MSTASLPHLIIRGFFQSEQYTAIARQGPGFRLPAQDRQTHGAAVREQLQAAQAQNAQIRQVPQTQADSARLSIEVRSEPGFSLKLDSLESKTNEIEVVNVRAEGDVQAATVHLPPGSLTYLLRRIEDYLEKDTKGSAKTPSKPKNEPLVASIGEIRLATFRSFFTDDASLFPSVEQPIWWEVWIRSRRGENNWDLFRSIATATGVTIGTDTIPFPDRVVGLVHGSAQQMMESIDLLDLLAEVRLAKERPTDFIELSPRDQAEWVEDLRARIVPPDADAPAVCLLDGGVVAHPLIEPALDMSDLHRHDPNWPLADLPSEFSIKPITHGTKMAGVALYGSGLAGLMVGKEPVALAHRLESVRILPPSPGQNEPRLYGAITSQAASRVRIAKPDRSRVFCMAVTSQESRQRGQPSSWSGQIDQMCASEDPCLFVVAAGNVAQNDWPLYPNSNDTDGVHDPAQAWNAITVGAYTDRVVFDTTRFPNARPIATSGDISPASTTSMGWDKAWPYKPDIVLEGGNAIIDESTQQVSDPEDLAMLTTAHATTGRLLVDFRDTSAATAQATRIAAILQAEYPELWPETIRALLIHSADWTGAMRRAFGTNKEHHARRLRRYGYGVPDLERARFSSRDALTLVSEQAIQPFRKEGADVKTNQMGLHTLPWPKEQLSELGDLQVVMRVTLSYFIEPKPGRREGFVKYAHRYQSHGLRFEVRRPQESMEEFRKRVSAAARTEDERHEPVGDTKGWELGPRLRTRGSVHSDWWKGPAADLANSGIIAVYPVSGWWRGSGDSDWAKSARYSLVVSIRTTRVGTTLFTPVEIDLYGPIQAIIAQDVIHSQTVEVGA